MINGFFIGFALALLLWFAAFLFLKAFVRRRTSLDYILGMLQEEVRELEADIDEKTEQSLELLEEKIHALRELCGEAERRIALYNRELEKRARENLAFAALGKKPLVERLVVQDNTLPPTPGYQTSAPAGKRETRAAATANRKKPAASASPVMPANPPAGPAHAARAARRAESAEPGQITISRAAEPLAIKPRPIGERIDELQKAGFSPELIAKRLDINIGEVELYFRLAEK